MARHTEEKQAIHIYSVSNSNRVLRNSKGMCTSIQMSEGVMDASSFGLAWHEFNESIP